MIQELIDSALVLDDLKASTKDAVLDEILAAAVDGGRLQKSKRAAIRKRLAEREELGSTGIGNGVAVPHVKADAVGDTLLVLARSHDGVDFDAVDGRPVHTVFLIVAPKDAAEEHLQLLRWISGLARSADFRRFFRSAADEREIRELLREMSGS